MHLPAHPIRFAILVALATFVVLGLIARAIRRWRAVPRDAWLVLDIKGPLTEIAPAFPPWKRLLQRRQPQSILAIERIAARVKGDARIQGVLLRLGELQCGWATAASLREVVRSLRDAGKRVIAYLPHGGMTRELYIATACERIFVTPQATLAPLGVASGLTFWRSLLARAGIEAESLSRREFKSAADTFTHDSLSEPNRMQLSALLDALHGTLVEAIASGRGRTADEAKTLVDRGLFRAPDAIAAGLIDDMAYDDEIADRLGTKPERMVRASRYLAATRPWPFGALRRRRGLRVGVVEVRGAIVTDAAVSLGRVADVRSVVGALRVARANPSVGAVVLFVDSPGGSALASDLMAREVERLAEKKPVVAYFSNTAASGGYYVAALANEIVAQPVSITGSIGVVALRFVFEQTLEKLGLRHEVIRRGDHADVMSPYRRWTDEERALFDHEIDGAYRDFVAIVAKGRKRGVDEIEPLSRGRVYAGKDAHAVGLVDRLGGLRTALDRAAELGKVPPSREPVLVHAPRTLPEPAEPRAPIEPIAARLGVSMDLVQLALSCGRDRLFMYEDRIASLVE